MNCKGFHQRLPELVLDASAKEDAVLQAHMAECQPCQQEYVSFAATMSLMDAWEAPEPSPYFDQKLAVLLRGEASAPRLGFFGRIRDYLTLNTGHQFRPVMAGVMALLLVLGGGGYAGFEGLHHASDERVSPTINDLQILDRNEQALQEMDQLLQDDTPGPGDAAANAPS